MNAKDRIIELFNANVKGKTPDVSDRNKRHDGRYGHWLEEQFGITANGNNAPDLYGYELKNETKSKTSFGDWSANEYVFTDPQYKDEFLGTKKYEKQWDFCKKFGKPNESRNGRCSWSGQACPKYGHFNDFGQKLIIDDNGNRDIVAIYSYSKDKRTNKDSIVPERLQIENLVIARWYGDSTPAGKKGKYIKKKLEDKFNDKGWFTCKTKDGVYDTICFGRPMNYDKWLSLVEEGIVFFDSGMYDGKVTEEEEKIGKKDNKRPYSQWRANNSFWDSLIDEIY